MDDATNSIDTNRLIKLLKMTQPQLKRHLEKELRKYGYTPVNADGYLYAEGTLPVAMIAHMDTVMEPPTFVHYKHGAMSGKAGLGADDRAGVYGILHLITQGFRPTVIFTEDEEIGAVGAIKFAKTRIKMNINYMIQLDRRGRNDAVFYDCFNVAFIEYVESFGFKEAMGSYSDISEIAPEVGVSAVNLSCGYYGEHTLHEVLIIDELARTIRLVSKMLSDGNTVKYKYVTSYKPKLSAYSKYYGYDDRYDNPKLYTHDYDYSKAIPKDYMLSPTSELLDGLEDAIPAYDCYIVFESGEFAEIETDGIYWIGVDDCVYTADGKKVPAYVTDYNWNLMGYADF